MPDEEGTLYYFEATPEACERCQTHEGVHPTDALAHGGCRCTASPLEPWNTSPGDDCGVEYLAANVHESGSTTYYKSDKDEDACDLPGSDTLRKRYTVTLDPEVDLSDDGRAILEALGHDTSWPRELSDDYELQGGHQCDLLIEQTVAHLQVTGHAWWVCHHADGTQSARFLRTVDDTVSFLVSVKVEVMECWDCGSDKPRRLPPLDDLL